MLVGLPALILVPLIAAFFEGVHLDPAGWARIIGGIWLGTIPLVLLGLLLGQFGTPESMQPISMLVMMGMSMLGGVFIPIEGMPDWMHQIAQALPTYWITQLVRPVVTHDLIGLFPWFTPKFVSPQARVADEIRNAARAFIELTRGSGTAPSGG